MSLFDSHGLAENEITREFFFNIGGSQSFMRTGIFLFAFIAIIYFIVSLVKRVNVWKAGQPELRTDFPEKRILLLFKYVLLQKRIIKDKFAGVMHSFVFFGFLVLALVTFIVFIQEDITGLFFRYKFIQGDFYIALSLAADVAGFLILFGLSLAMYRRFISKPSRLDHDNKNTVFLLFLMLIVVTGFFNEALRIALTQFPVFEKTASPVGYLIALPFAYVNDKTLINLHYINWMIHLIISFAFISHIAVGKIGHIFISILNIYFSDLKNELGETKYVTADLNERGVAGVEQFTWKDLMDCDACVGCGRCQVACPAQLTEKTLSPKNIITSIKDNIHEHLPATNIINDETRTPLINNFSQNVGSVDTGDILSCTNCGACIEVCPVNINPMSKINDMKRSLINTNSPAVSELKQSHENMSFYGNAKGLPSSERGKWIESLGDMKEMSQDSEVDYLFFAGCSASYDERIQKTAISFMNICRSAGLKIGILGGEEGCCGDQALRTGNIPLFKKLARKNIDVFNKYSVTKIITACPHGYNTLKKEYHRFNDDANFEIIHHSEIIESLISQGKIEFDSDASSSTRITYHDPCFLGRYNEKYETPRNVLTSIPGVSLLESGRSREQSLCCGSGGGRPLFENESGTKMSEFRARDLRSAGGEKICTACPLCLNAIAEGMINQKIDNLEVLDISEITWNAMKRV